MTDTAVRPPVVIFEEPQPRIRNRVAALTLAVLATGANAVGVASLASSPASSQQWQYPTTVEELVERGFIPAGIVGSAETKWAIPTSIDDLIEAGFDPTS